MKFSHKTSVALRFSDMDSFGHVNNACFLTYFEEARIKYIDDIVGWKYGWAKTGIILAHSETDFLIPVNFKDIILIKTCCSKIGTKSFTMLHQMLKIESEKEVPVSTAATVVVMYDYENNCSISVNEAWKIAIKKYEFESGNAI